MESTRIIRIHVPVGRMVQVQMHCDDDFISLRYHLVTKYPLSLPDWCQREVLFYHRTAGSLKMETRVKELSSDLELLVVRRNLYLTDMLRKEPPTPCILMP